ncbi:MULTISPECIES: SDR family NAD(P)-dependent oxidoreductase [unclassified Streptomyces]|uniref:SDR family NAD(P)-dependent oxidoreductase n=1 Tax=unclassified Streptomyces TaxID=2593676 RepID=UPI002E1F7663
MNHLQDKVVVITGASSGIGAVSAKALAAHGATIVAAARGQEDLDPLVADINKAGGTAAARLTDVTDAADMQALADFTVATGWADKVTDPAGRRAAQELNSIAISAQSVADAVVYALDQPAGVTVNDLIISPTRQNW